MASRLFWPRVVAGLLVACGSALILPAAAADAAPTKATTASAGYTHSCDVTTKGAARCWGYNGYGQLGDNSTTSSSKPVGVYGLGSKVKAISPGYQHTCAVTTKGKVWCWGDNSYGQLGDNTTTNSSKPVAVAGLGKAKAVDAGYFHTCALTTKGAVKCWGFNGYGQLGDNSTTSSLSPVTVYGISKGAKAVAAAYTHTCAIKAAGKAVCWGYNSYGSLGDNSTTSSPKPVSVYGLDKGVKQISTGISNTCAVNGKNKALCWGYNGNGQLGDNSTTESHKPVGVYGLGSGVKAVKTATTHSCALTTKGKVKCWGDNAYGQLGDNSTTSSLKPVSVYNLDKSVKVSVGYAHSCVLTSKKAVKCWGYNGYGEVGDNTTTNTSKPVKVYGY
jgi:alpha-tubulin suppressor-like RCC1 family protein